LDRSKLKLNLSVENANSIVLEVASIMDVPISKRNGQLTVSTCDSVVNINIDVPLMTSVLVNIMDNAIKYSKENLIINISTYVKEDFFFVSIKDNGIGMSEEAQSKIFDRFYRVSTNNKHNVKGFGLGLSYAKSIVLAHNGIISVSSKLGSGSTFTIKLPIVKNNKQEDYE
ncbi:MAG: HAMP domain-containing histidine kinase, partial [Bacteroidales bacterium]|nr:HAMP domain-containing histidine kinase [Bacteroidales bacterium]